MLSARNVKLLHVITELLPILIFAIISLSVAYILKYRRESNETGYIDRGGKFIVPALSVHPSHCCPEHISKSIEGNLMKLDTLIEGHEGNCRMQE